MKTYIVTAAVILEKDRVLLAQRKSDGPHGLKWEFPGGKLEEGESPEECVVREIKEELRMDIEALDVFKAVTHRYGDKNILLLAYLCRRTGGDPVPLGCRDVSWVPVEKIMDFDLLDADLPIAKKLREVYPIFFRDLRSPVRSRVCQPPPEGR